MKKKNRGSKQVSPVDASSSSSASDDKRKLQHYKERVRQLEQENKAFQVQVIVVLCSISSFCLVAEKMWENN